MDGDYSQVCVRVCVRRARNMAQKTLQIISMAMSYRREMYLPPKRRAAGGDLL